MDDLDLLKALADDETPAVLATVVSTKGSTPRKAGAKMIVRPGGTVEGTIGGGCGEGQVIEAAQALFEGAGPSIVQVDLTDEILSWSPAVCGGIMNVFIERVGEEQPRDDP
ncbi:MAG: XdhC family protein [Longimicrobiales bacterium]